MVFMLTLMLSCWALNSSTSCRMYGPSPPVNPFQKARSTFGPLYPLPPPPAPPCTAGLFCGPPPQPASASPAPAPTPRSRNSCRVNLRMDGRLSTMFSPVLSSVSSLPTFPTCGVSNPSNRLNTGQARRTFVVCSCWILHNGCRGSRSTASSRGDLPDAGGVRFGATVVGEEAVHLLLDVGQLGVAEATDGVALQQGHYEGLVALQELLGVGHGAVPPSPLFPAEGYAAELGDQNRLAPVSVARRVDWPPTRPRRDAR